MADVSMRILLSAAGGGGVVSAISGITSALGKGGLGGALLGITAAAAGTAIAIGVNAVQAFTNYQQAMVQLQNTTGSSDADMRQYTATIRQLSDTTGKAQTDLAKGMYQIISANFSGADATRILTTATRSSIIANADQTQVTTGLVVTLNAFGLKASQVDNVSNQMFKTLSLGRGSMGDLAGALQTGGALVAHYGLSVKDMDATLATLSTGGMKTFGTSMTGLTQLLNVMDGKTDLIAKRMQKLKIPFDEAKFKAMSFQQQVEYLNHALENNKGQEVAILGSKQAATALSILGTHASLLKTNIQKLGDTQELAKEKQDDWARTQKTAAFQMQLLQTHVQNFMIDLGAKLLPIVNNVITALGNFGTWIGNIVGGFGDWLQKSGTLQTAMNILQTAVQDVKNVVSGTVSTVQNIVSWFQQWHQIILTVASVITAFFVPALIKTGVEAGIAGVKLAASFIANIVKSGVEAVVNGAKIAAQFVANIVKAGVEGWTAAGKLGVLIGQFIASGVQAAIAGAKTAASWTANIIKSGVEAAIAGGKIAAQFVASMAQAAAQAVVAGAQIAAQFVATIIKAGVQAVITAGQFLGSLIPAIVSMAAEAVTAAITAIPGLIAGFIAWTAGAWAAAAATIAATWPILLIIAAIALLVVGIILLVTHWKQVAAFAEMIWGHIVKFFTDDVVKPIGNLFNQLGTKVHQIISGIGGFFDGLGTKAHQVTTNVGNFFSNLGSTAHGIWDGAKQKAGDFFSWLGTQGHNATTGVGNAFSWLGTQVHDKINDIGGFFSWLGTQANNLLKTIQNITGGIGQAFQNAGKWIGDKINSAMQAVKNAINWVINGINNFINFLDGIRINIPAINVGPVHIGGGSIGLPHIPDIPLLAAGGNVTVGGLAVVGEAGPELIQMPTGAQVIPLNGGSHAQVQGHTFNIYINTMARSQSEVNNLVNLIEQELGRRFRTQTPGYSVFSGAL